MLRKWRGGSRLVRRALLWKGHGVMNEGLGYWDVNECRWSVAVPQHGVDGREPSTASASVPRARQPALAETKPVAVEPVAVEPVAAEPAAGAAAGPGTD
jgi:hypothetical protein